MLTAWRNRRVTPCSRREGVLANHTFKARGPDAPIEPFVGSTSDHFALAKNLAEAATDAMLLSDGDGRVMFANSAALRLFNTDEDVLLGANLRVLVPGCPDDVRHDAPGYDWKTRVSVSGDGLVELQLNLRTLDPPQRSILALIAVPLTSPARGSLGYRYGALGDGSTRLDGRLLASPRCRVG